MNIAICGMAPHDTSEVDNFDGEIWGLPWDEGRWPFFDRYFEIHPLDLLRKPEAHRRDGYEDRLKSLPVLYMQEAYKDIPNAIRYPIEKVVENLGFDYFNSSISYLMGMALLEGANKIGIWGVDMADIEPTPGDPSYTSEFAYQRPNMEYLIGLARGRGIEVYIPEKSPLAKFHGEGIPLGLMYPSYPKRYGYL
jgi:hypothetical protein|tara:strand:+ start:297 stop:878 length:582 start_codon:yes stop_codon:yes gene_type:complete